MSREKKIPLKCWAKIVNSNNTSVIFDHVDYCALFCNSSDPIKVFAVPRLAKKAHFCDQALCLLLNTSARTGWCVVTHEIHMGTITAQSIEKLGRPAVKFERAAFWFIYNDKQKTFAILY